MKSPQPELHLRRLTVDEAMQRLEQYLYDAYTAGLCSVRVIHGKGTGRLRWEVQRKLRDHPLVKSFRQAGYGEGGAGATIVEVTDR